MHGSDPYGARDDVPGELPELPLARPAEWATSPPQPHAEPAEAPIAPIAPPALGASFTAAGGPQPVPVQDDLDETPPHDLQLLTWELAARLTAGMLANPTRSHASVKDAMGLFDQFLHEMHAYVRISEEFDLGGGADERRRSHVEYFRGSSDAADEQSAAGAPPAKPGAATPRMVPPQPPPTQPRPGTDYRPIPPGMRGPYTPGSMAGPPPPVDGDGDDAARRAA